MMLIRTSTESWNAEYTVQGNRDAQIVRIKSRSSITVVIAKIMENLPLVGKTVTYYITPFDDSLVIFFEGRLILNRQHSDPPSALLRRKNLCSFQFRFLRLR